MATIQSPDGNTQVITARRTESLDAPNIYKLKQSSTDAIFGRINIVNVIEKAIFAITLHNENDEILGAAAFFDYPPKTAGLANDSTWEGWLNDTYECSPSTSLNSLFVHLFVASSDYSHGCAREIVQTMFNAVPELHYCYLVVPTGVFPDSALAEIFCPLEKRENVANNDETNTRCAVFACYRHDHVPVLHVREARVEDHDDLVPIFNRQSDMLKMAYGDYFLAELIEAQDENMKCLVTETNGTAIGFMSISDHVNADLLNECFELGPFHGLRVPDSEDVLEPENQDDRPDSAASLHSVESTVSGSLSIDSDKLVKQSSKTSSKHSSRPQSNTSVKSREAKVKGRLSDVQMGDSGSVTMLSDNADVESIKSEASDRQLEKQEKVDYTVPKTPKPVTPRAQMSPRFVPKYAGQVNAFCIQLFCIDEKFEMRSCDFLPKAFEMFPDKDFCIITVPQLVPEFPLLQQFMRITPRCPSTLAQELYVFNRSGLFRQLQVKPACQSDTPAIETLVKTLELHENLLNDLEKYNKARRDDDGTEIQAFVAIVNKQIVGVMILRQEQNIEYLRSHYNIEDFIYFNHHCSGDHARLHHYALNPIFKHYSKHFIKEVLRLGQKTCLYYPLFPNYVDRQVVEKYSLIGALSDLVPVKARRQIDYDLEKLGGNSPSDRVLNEQHPCALNHINRKLVLEPKVTVNARIVIVGASDTAISFLESFAFCPHLRFNNLTLVSPHGLPGELPPDPIRDDMISSSHCYTHKDFAQMSLRSWVNTVYGKMTRINTKKKFIVINRQTVVPYDHLILTTGTGYQTPAPSGADITQLATNNELPNNPDRHYPGVTPRNLFTVNDQYDAAVALYWVETNLMNSDSKIIVYGSTIDVHCCIQSLLKVGIEGSRILLVQPPLNYEITCFNDPVVEKVIEESLVNAGVEIYSGFILAAWNDGYISTELSEEITSACFTSSTKPMRLECSAFFSYYKKRVDYDAFKAINDACLVYDGRLVIDAQFHTSEPAIRAAGPLTKFRRVYHADQWSHANFNSREVGLNLASAMLSLFDPTMQAAPEPQVDALKLIPLYKSPRIKKALLPGGFNYLQISKPSLDISLEALRVKSDFGREIITSELESEEKNYFRLHIDQYNKIASICCLTTKDFSVDNICCLYDLHERLLNNLVSRYDEGLISDLYSYFTETWCMAIFHDRFNDFRDEIRELLLTRPEENVAALEEKVREMIEEDLTLNKDQRKSLLDAYNDSGTKRSVEKGLLGFLSYGHYHLPMYAKPGMV